MLKRSAGTLFDRIWGPHSRKTIRERFDRAMDQVKVHLCDYMCEYVWLLNECAIAVDGT
jgi:hypothetical protein